MKILIQIGKTVDLIDIEKLTIEGLALDGYVRETIPGYSSISSLPTRNHWSKSF